MNPTEQDIDEIVKTYPNPRVMLPNAKFEDQMKTHLMKYFKLFNPPKAKDEQAKGRKR